MIRVLISAAMVACLVGDVDACRRSRRSRSNSGSCQVAVDVCRTCPTAIPVQVAKPVCPKPACDKPACDKPACDKPPCKKPPCTGPVCEPAPQVGIPSDVAVCISIANQHRARNGLAGLTFDMRLHGLCQAHSQRQAGSRRMHHSRLGMRENVAYGTRTATGVMSMWMNSSGHRANILSRSSTRIGVCQVNGYWTMILR